MLAGSQHHHTSRFILANNAPHAIEDEHKDRKEEEVPILIIAIPEVGHYYKDASNQVSVGPYCTCVGTEGKHQFQVPNNYTNPSLVFPKQLTQCHEKLLGLGR